MRIDQDSGPELGDDYNEWAARWMSQELEEEDLEEWREGRLSDHVSELMNAVGIGAIRITSGPDGRDHVVVVGR